MDQDVEGLRAELAELRAELAEMRSDGRDVGPARVSRRRLLSGLAGLGAAGAAGVVAAPPAAADDGESVVLGESNLSSSLTKIGGTFNDALLLLEQEGDGTGLVVGAESGPQAVAAIGGLNGVYAVGKRGVFAESSAGDGYAVLAVGHDDAIAARVSSNYAAAMRLESFNGPHIVFTPWGVGPPGGDLPIATGALKVDTNLDLWFCTQGGATPTWTRLLHEDTASGRTVPINPIRAIDTRAPGGRPAGAPVIPGQKAGPLKGGTSLTLDLAGAGPIPATATGVIGNLAVISPSFSGYLAARPSGTTATTSSLNFPQGVAAIANAFTSQLGPDGLTITGSGTSANTYHLVVDTTAYIT